MGQYYIPVLGPADQPPGTPPEPFVVDLWFYSHDYGNGLKLMEHSWVGNDFVGRVERALLGTPRRVVWAGDYADPEPGGEMLNELARLGTKVGPDGLERVEIGYVVNHDAMEYVFLGDLPARMISGSDFSWIVHPLPLLTAEGNGRGGGDYAGFDGHQVGRWARALISTELPDWEVPDGYEALDVAFLEGR